MNLQPAAPARSATTPRDAIVVDGGMDARAVQRVTGITAAAAVVAGVVLVAAHFVPALGTPGLMALFGIPLVRNVAVVVYARGVDRWLGLLGAIIVTVVVGSALWLG